jgi:hypothetical protein
VTADTERERSGRLPPALAHSFTAGASQADGPRELRALLGVARGDYRVVGGQAVALPVAARVQAVGAQVALERLVGLAVDEAGDAVVSDRLADLSGRWLLDFSVRSHSTCAAFGAQTGNCSMHPRNQGWQFGWRDRVIRDVG